MSTENSSTKFKVIIGLLSALLIIAMSVYTYTLYNDNKETVTGLETQKDEIKADLQALITDYDGLIQENVVKDKDLLAARERIESLLEDVKDAEANVDLIRRYKIEVGKLKNERILLFRRADSLAAANQLLAMERDSTNVILNETIKVIDFVSTENIAMSETLKKGAIVNAVDLRGEAVIIRNSGKIVDTKRSSRADKVRACFTLTPNPIALKGDRTLYVQVINPKNNLLGKKAVYETENGTINYSESTNVFYENEELDVCILVNAIEADLIEGKYIINVFDGEKQVASTSMELK